MDEYQKTIRRLKVGYIVFYSLLFIFAIFLYLSNHFLHKVGKELEQGKAQEYIKIIEENKRNIAKNSIGIKILDAAQ